MNFCFLCLPVFFRYFLHAWCVSRIFRFQCNGGGLFFSHSHWIDSPIVLTIIINNFKLAKFTQQFLFPFYMTHFHTDFQKRSIYQPQKIFNQSMQYSIGAWSRCLQLKWERVHYCDNGQNKNINIFIFIFKFMHRPWHNLKRNVEANHLLMLKKIIT